MSKKPKSILNDPSHAVEEFVQGLCWQYPHRLIKLQHHNVLLLRRSAAEDATTTTTHRHQIQLLSGGGSGHEPSHAGWIGTGMLRGAVCGGIFASPSVASILAAIRAAAATTTSSTSTKNPVLLIVKNYTGDRLNFGLACERANNEGLECDLVVIADDVALPRTKGITGARGVAGTVLLHKIAGAAAAAQGGPGQSLSELKAFLQTTAACLGTLGMALDSVTVPGATTINDRLHDDSIMEIGLGIHGEAGLRQSKVLTSQEMAKEMIDTIQNYGRVVKDDTTNEEHVVPMFQVGDELALLVNNLGGSSNFELSILAKDCVETAEALGAKVSRVYVGSYMTSFNMHGASLTILNLTAAPRGVADYLDAPTDAPAWVPCEIWKPVSETDIRPSLQEWDVTGLSGDATEGGAAVAPALPPVAIENFGSLSKKLVEAAAHALIEQEPLLTQYDTIVGDGDCGITMKRGATQVLSVVEPLDSSVVDHPVTLFAALADAVSESMGGTSGVLLELMFRKMSSTLARSTNSIGAVELAQAFEAGVNAVSLYGGAKVGARTMLDALVPAAALLVQATTTSDSSSANILQAAAEQARQGADQTATMAHASAGRSNYLSEETLAGTPDPGAVAVAVVFEAMAKS